MADFDDLLAPPSGGTFDALLAPAAGIRQKPRSALGEIGTGLRTGVTEGVPLMAGQSLQWLGEPTGGGFRQGVYEAGKSIADAAKARQELPENKLRPEEHGAVVNALAEGGSMLAPSLAPPLAVAAGLALLPEAVGASALAGGAATALRLAPKVVQAVSKLAPLVTSSAIGAVPAAMQAGQQTLESVQGAGASDEVARVAGWKNLFIEGLGEFAGTAIGGKFAGLAGKTLGKAAAPTVAGTIKAATDAAVWKPFAKGLVNTAVGEVGTEIGQAGLQASVEREAGVDVSPLEQMKAVVGPTLGMTAFLAPFGLHANYSNARSAKAVNTIIEDPTSATPEQRQAVVDELHKQAVANKVPDADQWLVGAKEDIAAGLPIRRVANVIREEAEPAAQATNTVQAETLNQATSDEVKIDKVEDGVATVTVGDRTVDIAVSDAAAAVAAGNLEEVLAGKEETIDESVINDTLYDLADSAQAVQDEADVRKRRVAFDRLQVQEDLRREDDLTRTSSAAMANTVPFQEGAGLAEEQARTGEATSPSEQAAQGLTEVVSPAQDTPAGTNYAGEPLFDRLDGSRYRIRMDRKDRPGGYPDFGGDLAPVEQSAEAAQGVNDEFTVPEQVLPVDESLEGDQAVTPVPQVPTGGVVAPVQEGVQLPDGKGAVASFEALDTLSKTATKQTITTGDLFTTLEQSPDENVKKLGGFLKSFTPGSKLESAVKVDPAAKTAGYAPGKNEITVKDLKNAPTSLHELVHSVTVRELKIRPDMQKRVRGVMALVKVQVTQLGLISKDTISNIEIAGGSKTFKNKFLAGELSGMEQIGYGLLNEQEFLAQAFSSPQFQGVLKATQIKTGGKYRSAWDALVEKVMQVLGIESKHASAFSEALSIAAQLAGTDVSGAPLQAQSTKGGIASRSGQGSFTAQVQKDLKSFLGKGYDNLVKRGKLEVVRNANDLPQQMQKAFLKMVAWHGTPHDVDKFSSSKIGTGEGAQAYGYGLYFAGSREVAEWYKDKLSASPKNIDATLFEEKEPGLSDEVWAKMVAEGGWGDDKSFALQGLLAKTLAGHDGFYIETVGRELYNRVRSAAQKVYSKGKLYQVELAPAEDEYLLWDKPLGEQSEKVKAALPGIKDTLGENYVSEVEDRLDADFKDWTGKELIQALNKYAVEEGLPYVGQVEDGNYRRDVSTFLHSTGIRGNKYLDGTSRSSGDGNYNYVIFNDEDIQITAIFSKNGEIAGSYFPSQKKVFLFSDNLKPGDAVDVMRHEAGHALLNEDKVFRAKRTAILKDFAILARNNPAIKAAFAKVPSDTAKGFRGEEALMYWLQEKSNRKHSIFKRIISAVKAALYRLGIAHGRLSESDLVALFSQGTKAWSRRTEDQAPTGDLSKILARLDQPEQLFSVVSDKMKEGQAKIDQILDAVQNPKSRLRDIYVKYAPQWLAVMPRSHLAQTFGKKIHWLKDIDTHNKKMEAIKAQLPDDFYAIYQDAEAVAKKNSGLEAFNNLLLTGTFNQMTPWLDETEQDWFDTSGPAGLQRSNTEKAWKAEGMKKSTGKTFAEAYQEVRTAWDKLKPAEQEQVKKIVDYLASLRERERNNLLAVIEASSEKNPGLRASLMTQFNATFGKLKGIYVPLSRYGEYILKFTTQDGREQTEFFTSPGERRVFRKQMEAQGVDPDTFVEDVKRETQKGEAVIPQALREQLGKALEAKYLTGVDLEDAGAVNEAQARAADAFSDLNQVILRWMPETSALKNSIHRKNVLGASTDMLRSSMGYVLRHAGSIAWMEYGRKIEEDIQGFEEETKGMVKDREGAINTDMRTHLANDARRWFQAVKNERVSPIASTLGKFSTAYYMTSPSTFLVQLTQLPVLTLPALARKFASLPKATAALSEGLWKAFNKKYSKDAMYGDEDVNRVYADLHLKVTEKNRVGDRRLGEDFFSPAEMLQKIKGLGTGEAGDYKRELLALRESLAKGDLDISAVHEAQDIDQGNQLTAFGRAMHYAMLPMQHGELGSRKATVLASYKLATDAKKDFFSALEDSSEIVGGTLYNYAKSDKGWFMQGDTVRTLTTFQTYRIKTALRMGILLMQSVKGESPEVRRAALKEFLGVTAMSAALAGVHGTIIGGIVFGLANLFGGDDDEPYDAELEFDKWANERLGDLFGGILSYGLPTAFGVNASKRIGMGDLYGVSSEPPENMHGAQLAAWYAGNLIGPSFSVAQSWVKGYDQMVNKGNYMRGLEEALPKPLKDGLKAFRVASDGLKTGAGKKLIADEDINQHSILMLALGFNPDEVAKAQGAERSLNKIGTQLSERIGRLIRDAAKAIVESEDTGGPMAAIAAFNAKLPLFAINGSDLRPAVRKLVLGEVGTTGLRQRQVASQFGVPVYQGK